MKPTAASPVTRPTLVRKPFVARTPASTRSRSSKAVARTVRTPLPELPPFGPPVNTREVTVIGCVASTTSTPLPSSIPKRSHTTSSRVFVA